MNLRYLTLSIALLTITVPAQALKMEELMAICDSVSSCDEHPIVQAYVGGSLDFIAALEEDTDYLSRPLYCKDPRNFFDVGTIIGYMESHANEYHSRNAMLAVIRYLVDEGGCV